MQVLADTGQVSGGEKKWEAHADCVLCLARTLHN